MSDSKDPLLSVVVVIVSDTTATQGGTCHLLTCLEALSHQANPPTFEIIVPYLPGVVGIDGVKERFQDVLFFPIDNLLTYTGRGGSREHHDALRARGLAVARGEIVALLEDHGRPAASWSSQVVAAHRQAAVAGVGGAIENGIDRAVNWAVYFCDFGKYQNPVCEGESLYASDANVSYKRSALESIRPVWQNVFQETAVNSALTSGGQKLALSPKLVVYQHRDNLRFSDAMKERFIWGRSYAAARAKLLSDARRMVLIGLCPALPVLLIVRMALNVLKKQRSVAPFVRALPITLLLTLSWSLGELIGYLKVETKHSTAASKGERNRVSANS